MQKFTESIIVDNAQQAVTLTIEELDTLNALFHNSFNALRRHCIGSLWGKGLLWSDCNPAGVKINFNGINWLDKHYS